MNLIDTPHCSGANCRRCRDREGGRGLRVAWERAGLVLPAGGVDFECPKELAWGWKPGDAKPATFTVNGMPAAKRPRVMLEIQLDPAIVAARTKICSDCEHNVNGVCLPTKAKNPSKRGLVSVGVKMAHARCPLDPPKWIEAQVVPTNTPQRPSGNP